MKRLVRACSAVCLGLLLPAVGRADLAADVRDVLDDKLLSKAKVSIDVVRLGTNETDATVLYQQNATTPCIPASNLKVVTTSAALEYLGSDFNFHTMLLAHDGDLILVGDGDPTFGDDELYHRFGWNVETVFKSWAAVLAKKNLTTVKDIKIDDGVFDTEFFHPHWPPEQAHKRYVAEVGGLNFNANCIDFYVHTTDPGALVTYTMVPNTAYATIRNTCVGGSDNAIWLSRQPGGNDVVLRGTARSSLDIPVSVTVHDPSMFTGTALAEMLKANGINVTGKVVRDRTARDAYAKAVQAQDKTWTAIAVHETPLTAAIARANKDSMNLYAESICKRLGFAKKGVGSWANGTASVGEFLKGIGVADAEFHLDDGCGLSKQNNVSSHLMVTVLTHDYFGKNSKAFLSTLAVAGEDGTLSERFHGSDIRGRLFGKSGFVNGVSSLSGYLHGKDDKWYCFSILLNGIPDGSNSGVKTLQERIIKAVDIDCAGGGTTTKKGERVSKSD